MGRSENITHEEAWALTAKTLELLKCAGKKANVCVTNRNGQVMMHVTMDGTRPVTTHLALLKAQQSACTGERTSTIRDMIAANTVTIELFGWTKEKLVPWPGGVPIYSKGGIQLGGLGVSNLYNDEDEYFAIKALEEMGMLSDRPNE